MRYRYTSHKHYLITCESSKYTLKVWNNASDGAPTAAVEAYPQASI